MWCRGVRPTFSKSLCLPETRRHFCELVARLYRDTLQDAYTQVDRLHYDGLNWGDAEAQQLAHTMHDAFDLAFGG